MWSTDDVASWLEDWDLEDYIHTFREKEDLEYLGIVKLGDRIRIYRDIQQRVKTCAASQSNDSAAENRLL
jgi:hypothetical protein